MQSTRYQDYVIADGKYIGKFEDMYKNSAEVPWHQDKTVNAIFSDIAVVILRQRSPDSLLDVGCGMGYMAERFRVEIPTLKRVAGIDVSETAVVRARSMFPEIEFMARTIGDHPSQEKFDVVVSKDVLWYVLDDLQAYLSSLAKCSRRWVYIGQSFPEKRPFYGEDILPDAKALIAYLSNNGFPLAYSAIESDAALGGREYVHALIEVSQ